MNIFVSLNPSILPSKKKIFKKIYYDHPLFDLNTFKNQKKITAIQGIKNICFCGAYLGYGFHEDGIQSSAHISKLLGCNLPWQRDYKFYNRLQIKFE